MKTSLLVKMAAGVAAAGTFAFLFMRSLEDTTGAPYTIPSAHLRNWTLAIEPAAEGDDPFLVLRPSPELVSGLFRQVFSRAMESLNTPAAPSVAVMLRREFDQVVGERLTRDALIAAARAAGLESSPTPSCLVHRRVSEPAGVRQVYFVYLNAPAIAAFRQQVGLDPHALPPILFIAGAGADFDSWLPQQIDPGRDCLAPVEIAG